MSRQITRPLSIAVRLTGGMGDVLLASPFLEAMYDAIGAECEITAFYHTPAIARFIFAGARYVHAVKDVAELGRAATIRSDLLVHTGHFPRYVVHNARALEQLATPEFRAIVKESERVVAGIRGFVDHHPRLDGVWARLLQRDNLGTKYLDGIGQVSGLPVDHRTYPFLALDPKHRTRPLVARDAGGNGSILVGDRFITVHDGFDNRQLPAAGQATKCWPLEHWTQLVAILRSRYRDAAIVQLGAGKSRRIPGVDLCLVDSTTLEETAWILKDALVHVDTDSGIAHLAHALHTPAVVLFGPTNSYYFGHDTNRNVGVGTCSDCWWSTPDWLAKCPRGLAVPACMQAIEPEHVATIASDVIKRRDRERPKYSAGPLRCYDGMSEETRSIADAIALTAGLEPGPITGHLVDGQTGVYVHASKQWEYPYAVRAMLAQWTDFRHLHVADVGGGRGALASFLAKSGAYVEQFDRDYQWGRGNVLTESAYQRYAKGKGYRARFGSIYNLPATSDAYDVVLCMSVLEHLPDKPAALRELLRILRPGGICVLTFDLALEPERFTDALRVGVADPLHLATWLDAVGVYLPGISAELVESSLRGIQNDGVAGIPDGMTVAGLTITKAL